MTETAGLIREFFGDRVGAAAIFGRVQHEIGDFGPFDIRVGKSQISFRRRRGFAYIWLPDMYLRGPNPEAVLSIALPYEVSSSRFKQVVNPAPSTWMHHLEMHELDDVDDEVVEWLRAAYEAAG